jgi:transposase
MVKCAKGQLRRLKRALWRKGRPQQRQRIQMVLLRESGMTQPAIAEAMGVSLSTVNRAHMAYDHGGLKTLKPKPIGGRKRENMTLAEERSLLDRFAKAAGAGEMLNIHDLKAAYEKAIGHETSNSTIFCNGPPVVNPPLRHPVAGSRFCPGSAQGRHLMGSE